MIVQKKPEEAVRVKELLEAPLGLWPGWVQDAWGRGLIRNLDKDGCDVGTIFVPRDWIIVKTVDGSFNVLSEATFLKEYNVL